MLFNLKTNGLEMNCNFQLGFPFIINSTIFVFCWPANIFLQNAAKQIVNIQMKKKLFFRRPENGIYKLIISLLKTEKAQPRTEGLYETIP